ncbi:polyprenyl synthetase family protein [Streptomyces sp. NPDC048111]|uniref:polyprenyl synthetase family protein n=1 Tax=Streptomyces sp. NPDC048111 TaxID=3365500 RepID=UPI0037131874
MTRHEQTQQSATPAAVRDLALRRVEERMGAVLADEHGRWAAEDQKASVLVSDLAAVLRTGRDRARSSLLLTGYLAAGGDPRATEAVDAAAALEFLDTWLLIRGDVRDSAALRRGLPTLHVSHAAEHERNGWRGESRRFGEGAAVLAGDLALVYADRLAAGLPPGARRVWDELRAERVLGAHASAAASAAYEDDPWPGRCVSAECPRGCGAGWYAVRHPLLLGAVLAGRPELAAAYGAYGDNVHAGWRLRGFLSGGPEFGGDAELLRDVLFDGQSRSAAETLIGELAAGAAEALAATALSPVWQAELGICGALLMSAGR